MAKYRLYITFPDSIVLYTDRSESHKFFRIVHVVKLLIGYSLGGRAPLRGSRGKFTEFVVRAYYCIYKACANNDGKCCFANDVSARKIKGIIYEGFYDGVPDHDNKEVFDDCIYHLKSMNYIKFKKENDTH